MRISKQHFSIILKAIVCPKIMKKWVKWCKKADNFVILTGTLWNPLIYEQLLSVWWNVAKHVFYFWMMRNILYFLHGKVQFHRKSHGTCIPFVIFKKLRCQRSSRGQWAFEMKNIASIQCEILWFPIEEMPPSNFSPQNFENFWRKILSSRIRGRGIFYLRFSLLLFVFGVSFKWYFFRKLCFSCF